MPTSWEDALTLARQHSEQQGEKWVFRWGSFDIVADNKRELVALLAQALGERRERDGGVAPPEPPVPTAEEVHALARSHGTRPTQG